MPGDERLPETESRQSPLLSIVVIFHNMQREAERTLYSLSSIYQQNLSHLDYEIIAIDNGSGQRLNEERVGEFGPNFRYHFLNTDSVSPVGAVNEGVSRADGEYIAVIVDGARMVTPGLVSATLNCLKTGSNPFVCALAWHLGPDVQRLAMEKGYDQAEEDRLLESIDWPDHGYRLFDIATIAPSSRNGFLNGLPVECSWFAMRRDRFLEMNGFDERFQSPGGGFVNHDFVKRIQKNTGFDQYVLLGEGSFHQMHGGVATNSRRGEHPEDIFNKEYQNIHGQPFKPMPEVFPSYFGIMPPEAMRFVGGKNKRV